MKFRYCLIVSVILAIALTTFAPSLRANSLDSILPTLLTSSSVIFAIIGAWIAVIYPELLSSAFKVSTTPGHEADRTEVNIDRLSTLVQAGTLSAITLAGVIVIQVTTPIARVLLQGSHYAYLKWMYLYVIIALCLTQLYSITKLVSINYLFLDDLRKSSNAQRLKRLRM
jgi:hypothetical protein